MLHPPSIKPEEIQPHAAASPNVQQQNVTFLDEEPGFETDVGSNLDSLRDDPMNQDATLDDFFARPVRIATVRWDVGGPLSGSFHPWELFFNEKHVINRIAKYKLLTAELCVKIVVNGSPFHYGRSIMVYTPFSGYDEFTPQRPFVEADLVQASQKPHVYINPSISQGGCMSLPFTWWENTLDITSDSYLQDGVTDFKRMGRLDLHSLVGLKHANGGTDSATIQIYAWAKNVKYSIPTNVDPSNILPQAGDEYTGSGVLSRPAMAVSNFLSKVSAPSIQPYITATVMATKTAAHVASLFGYSKPVMLTSSRTQRNTKNNFSVSNMEDDTAKLTLDCKQELSVDPSAYGLGPQDELDIHYIASRESYLSSFRWPVGEPVEQLLWNCVVDPMVPVKYLNELHLPAVTFAAMPFSRWRGSMKYRFSIASSAFHRGRLKVVWDPSSTATGEAHYNTAYTTIVDMSNTTDFEIVVGWGQSTTYRKMNDIFNLQSSYINTERLFYDSNEQEYGNGTLSVFVVNELAVPMNTIDNDVVINVFVSAGDDFEVAMPTGERVTRLRMSEWDNIVPQADSSAPKVDSSTGVPEHPAVAETMGNTIPISDPANLMHFGESIRSFRQLLKRYNRHEAITPFKEEGYTIGSVYHTKVQRPSLPFEPGYTNKADIFQADNVPYRIGVTPNAKPYAYSTMTLMRYLSTGFVGWRGSIRYMVDTGVFGCGCSALGPATVTRYSDCTPQQSAYVMGDQREPAGQGQLASIYDDASGQEGFFVQNVEINPTVSFEVPFYSEKRFMPARQFTNFNLAGTQNSPCWKLFLPFRARDINEYSAFTTFVAAGEDFSLGFFVGAPVFYLESIPPTGPPI
jgi:hypothetical protein